MRKLPFIAIIAAALLCSAESYAQRQLNRELSNWESTFSELADMDSDIQGFIKDWRIKGLSLSVMRNDSLLFARGYGWADKEKNIKTSPGTTMRIASVSKLLTSVGIMVLQERGQLKLSDKVFGKDGILSEYTNYIIDSAAFSITVENLLRHEGGFDERGGDPMFMPQTISRNLGLSGPPSPDDICKYVLRRPLRFYPGSSQDYSNFSYLLLSMVIEKVTGSEYELWMQENVLYPAGCFDMHICNNYYEEKFPSETRYYMPAGSGLSSEFNGSGRRVEHPYGGADYTTLSGGGAWIASTPELARLVASIDARGCVEDIISNESVQDMTRYYDNHIFPLGWISASPWYGWTRTGTLSSTHAIIRYYPDGECWIVLVNTGSGRGSAFSARELRALCDHCRENYSYLLPARNLFKDPATSHPSPDRR